MSEPLFPDAPLSGIDEAGIPLTTGFKVSLQTILAQVAQAAKRLFDLGAA